MSHSKPTFKLVIPNEQKKDGTWALKIRITYNRKATIVNLPYSATNEDVRRNKNTITLRPGRTVTYKTENLIKSLNQFAVFADEKDIKGMTPGQLYKFFIKKYNAFLEYGTDDASEQKSFSLDFPKYARKVAASKKKSTRKVYINAINSFCTFIGKEEFDISEIKSTTLKAFEKHLTEKFGGYTKTIPLYIGCLKRVHKEARMEFNAEETGEILIKDPYAYYEPSKRPLPNKVEPATREVIQYLIDNLHDFKNDEKKAAELFLLIFSLQGMNVADMLTARAPINNVIIFYREKTKDQKDDRAETHVMIHDVIRPLYEKYKDPEGIYAFKLNKKYKIEYFHVQAAKWMKALRARLKIEERFREDADKLRYGSARHSYATISREMGIDKGIVNDGMSHSDKSTAMTDRYIKKNWHPIWDANRIMLESFDWNKLTK